MRAHQLGLLGSALLVAACVSELPPETSTTSNVETHNRLGGNRLGGNRLGGNRLAAGRLASARLSSDTLVLDSEGASLLLATEDGREVLTYIISCAVPEGTILTDLDPAPGAPSEYFGSLGVAPQWLDGPLDDKGIGWVSACLFARVNANAEAVPISLRAAIDPLATGDAEAEVYSVQEGAFWGNYFLPLDEPLAWFSCRGTGQAAGETGGLVDRDCAEPNATNPNESQCGFVYTGDCFDHRVCRQEKNGMYSQCAGAGNKKHRQVITTYVTPD